MYLYQTDLLISFNFNSDHYNNRVVDFNYYNCLRLDFNHFLASLVCIWCLQKLGEKNKATIELGCTFRLVGFIVLWMLKWLLHLKCDDDNEVWNSNDFIDFYDCEALPKGYTLFRLTSQTMTT